MKVSDQERSISRVLRAIDAIKNEGMVIMVDEEDRENEGDIVFAGDHVSAEKINFMAKHARGLICLALEPKIIDKLNIPMMRDEKKSGCVRETAFTMSIEAKHGVTTGISAADRAHTIQVAVSSETTEDDIVVPGHIFPLRSREGGVIERSGHTEGSVDLAKLAGLSGSAVICEVMNEDGTMSRMPDLEKLAEQFDLPIITIPDLISYRLMQESLVEVEMETQVKTTHGDYNAILFRSKFDGSQHFAMMNGASFENEVTDVRVHIQRPLADVFSNDETGSRQRIDLGMQVLKNSPRGVFVYIGRSSGADGFKQDVQAMFADHKKDPSLAGTPVGMDQRSIGIGAQILRHLGVSKMRVHSTSTKPYKGLSGFNLEVVESVLLDGESTRG